MIGNLPWVHELVSKWACIELLHHSFLYNLWDKAQIGDQKLQEKKTAFTEESSIDQISTLHTIKKQNTFSHVHINFIYFQKASKYQEKWCHL